MLFNDVDENCKRINHVVETLYQRLYSVFLKNKAPDILGSGTESYEVFKANRNYLVAQNPNLMLDSFQQSGRFELDILIKVSYCSESEQLINQTEPV